MMFLLMISSICAAKSKFLKKEKSCALTKKLRLIATLKFKLLNKKFLKSFEET